jgi:hypothetical protein
MSKNDIKTKKDNKDIVANTLITTSDVILVILASLIVSLSFIVLSIYSEFVRNNDLIIFTLFEVVAFVGILSYKWSKR